MSVGITPVYGPGVAQFASARLAYYESGEYKLAWASTRITQKLRQLVEPAQLMASPNVLGQLRVLPFLAAIVGAALFVVGLLNPFGISLLAIAAATSGGLMLAMGVAAIGSDVLGFVSSRNGTPEGTFRGFFSSLRRRDYQTAYEHLFSPDRNGVIRRVRCLPGLEKRDPVETLFDTREGFARYWGETLRRGRPKGWSQSALWRPVRWMGMGDVTARQLSQTVMVVSGRMTLHHVPLWAMLSVFCGVIPAFFLIPLYYRRIDLAIRKALVKTRHGWAMLNGELLSPEDRVAAKV